MHLDEHLSRPAHGTHCAGRHTLHVVIQAHDLPDDADGKVLRRGSLATAGVSGGGGVGSGVSGEAGLFLRSALCSVIPRFAALSVPAFAACACGRRVVLRSLPVDAFLGSSSSVKRILLRSRQGLCLLLCEVLVPALHCCRSQRGARWWIPCCVVVYWPENDDMHRVLCGWDA